jgi:hypothetical protein
MPFSVPHRRRVVAPDAQRRAADLGVDEMRSVANRAGVPAPTRSETAEAGAACFEPQPDGSEA